MNTRQLGPPFLLILIALAFSAGAKVLKDYTSEMFLVLGVVAAGAVLVGGGEQKPVRLTALLEALRAAKRGKKVSAPDDATGELAEAYEEVGALAKKSAELTEEVARLEENAGGGGPDVD